MKPEIKQVIEWLLAQGLSPLPVAPQQDSREYPKVNYAKGKNYDHCPLDENLNPIPLYTGKNPSYLNKSGEPNLVNHSNYQNKQPSESILKRWFQNPNNGIGALGKDDFCWLDLDSKCFESQTKCEAALNKIFERCPELMNGILEKTHSGGFRLGFRVKEPKTFTNFAVEIGGKHCGELLGAGRFAVLAPSVGPSGNSYVNISRPDKLPVIEQIDFVYPVGQTASITKPVRPVKREVVHSSGQALDLRDLLNDEAFAVLNGSDTRNDESFSLCMLFKDAKGWENWLQNKNIPFGNSAEALVYYGGSNLGLDEAKCDRVMKSVKEWENLQPAAMFKGGDESCWGIIKKLSKQIWANHYTQGATDKKVEVKTTKPLQEPTTYTDDPSPDEPSDQPDEPIILPPEYSYQERAVTAIYGRGKYLSHGGELYGYNGKYYEKLEAELEFLKIRDWAKKECEWDHKEKRYVYKYLTPACLEGIWKWTIITFAVSSKLINPPGLNLNNGILQLYEEEGTIKAKLLKHSPDKYFLYCSDVSYNPDADPTECHNLLKALDPPQCKIFVQTLAASLDLAWVRKYQGRIKAIIAKGTGSNGKDSIKSAIARIFTPELICNVPFSSFKAYDNGSKYDLTKLRDKKINWASENNQTTVLDRSESLNCAITGNGIDYRDMNKLPKEFEPVCINIFNVNLVPKATGGLESFLSRFAVIEFNKTFANDPDESQGQIKADARFAYDTDFMRDEVCPALLNLLLAEFPNVVRNGIDYSPLKASLNILQEESNHLFGFIREYRIVADPQERIYVKDLWECLQAWYMANGTLELEEMSNGNKKPIWHDQSNKYDRNVVASNQVIARFKEIFPKTKAEKETKDKNRKGQSYIAGIGFKQELQEKERSENDKNSEQGSSIASLPHHSQSTRVVASPIASPSLTSPHLEKSEAVSEAVRQCGEAVMTVYQESEAVRQSNGGDTNSSNSGNWVPVVTVGLENLYRGDWVACADGIPLKLETRRKNFWEAIPQASKDSLEVAFSEISLVYR